MNTRFFPSLGTLHDLPSKTRDFLLMKLVALFAYRLTPDENDPFELIDVITVSEFPNKTDISIFWALKEDGKDHEVRLIIAYPNSSMTMELNCPPNANPESFWLYGHELYAMNISNPGTYAIRLKVDGEVISEYPIEVMKDVS